jgi:hypothetical protein
VNQSVMRGAQEDQIRQLGLAAIRPVLHVVCIADPKSAARKSAASVTVRERTSDRHEYTSRPATHVQHIPALIVRHHDARRVACDTACRFRGNANAVSEHRLARFG